MKKLNIIILICSLVSFAMPQNKVATPKNKKARKQVKLLKVSKKSPTVYISYERSIKVKDPVSNENEEMEVLLFRLHNNAPVKIWFEASGGDETYEEAALFYDILDDEKNEVESVVCHFCSMASLKPGESILFGVLGDYFYKGSAMRLEHYYDGDQNDGRFDSKSPVHYVYFNSSAIPRNVAKR